MTNKMAQKLIGSMLWAKKEWVNTSDQNNKIFLKGMIRAYLNVAAMNMSNDELLDFSNKTYMEGYDKE